MTEFSRYAGRPEHPYVDQFTNEWAWAFEDGFNRLAAASADPEDFQHRLAAMWDELLGHKEEMASAWAAFCGRKVRDVVASTPFDLAVRYAEEQRPITPAVTSDSDATQRLRLALDRLERPVSPEPEPPSVGSV